MAVHGSFKFESSILNLRLFYMTSIKFQKTNSYFIQNLDKTNRKFGTWNWFFPQPKISSFTLRKLSPALTIKPMIFKMSESLTWRRVTPIPFAWLPFRGSVFSLQEIYFYELFAVILWWLHRAFCFHNLSVQPVQLQPIKHLMQGWILTRIPEKIKENNKQLFPWWLRQ